MNGTNGSVHLAHNHVRQDNGQIAQHRVDNNTSTNREEDKGCDEPEKIPIMISFSYGNDKMDGSMATVEGSSGSTPQIRTLELREIVSGEDDHDRNTADFCREMVEKLASRQWLSSMCRYIYNKEGSEDMNLILHYGSDCHTKILMRKSSENTEDTTSNKSLKQVNMSIILKMTENGYTCILSPNTSIWDQLSSIENIQSARPWLQVDVIHDIFIDTSSISSRIDDSEHVITFNIPSPKPIKTPKPSQSKARPSESNRESNDGTTNKKQTNESDNESESTTSESPTYLTPSNKRKRSTPSRPRSSLEKVKFARKQPSPSQQTSHSEEDHKDEDNDINGDEDESSSNEVKPGHVSKNLEYYCMKENETISTIMKKTGCKKMEDISCNSENLEKYGPIIQTKGIRFKRGSMLRIPKRSCDFKLLHALVSK